jgi:glutaminyl-tRNA synthetase
MYDFAHPLEDAFEGVTHSLCTLEFEVHRPLYDWVVEQLDLPVRPPPVRVRAPQPQLHRDEQAQAARTGAAQTRQRLGRPPHAHHLRPAPARLPPPAIRQFCDIIGITKFEQPDRRGPAGALRARRAEQNVAPAAWP